MGPCPVCETEIPCDLVRRAHERRHKTFSCSRCAKPLSPYQRLLHRVLRACRPLRPLHRGLRSMRSQLSCLRRHAESEVACDIVLRRAEQEGLVKGTREQRAQEATATTPRTSTAIAGMSASTRLKSVVVLAEKRLVCPRCGAAFAAGFRLRRHLDVACRLVRRRSELEDLLAARMRGSPRWTEAEIPEQARRLINARECPNCGAAFPDTSRLRRHLAARVACRGAQRRVLPQGLASEKRPVRKLTTSPPKEEMDPDIIQSLVQSMSPCPRCGTTFTAPTQFRSHLESGTGCLIARRRRQFLSLIESRLGYAKRAGADVSAEARRLFAELECPDCGTRFRQSQNLRMHMASQSACRGLLRRAGLSKGGEQRVRSPLETGRANGVVQSSPMQRDNITNTPSLRNDKDRHACSRCGLGFWVAYHLRRHLESETACQNAQRQRDYKQSLQAKRESKAEPPSARADIKCATCETIFTKRASLRRHHKSNVACPQALRRAELRKRLSALADPSAAPGPAAALRSCPACQQSFGDSSMLRRHLDSDSACRTARAKATVQGAAVKGPDGRLGCPRCAFSARIAFPLAVHMRGPQACRAHSTRIVNLAVSLGTACPNCGTDLRSTEALRVHLCRSDCVRMRNITGQAEAVLRMRSKAHD